MTGRTAAAVAAAAWAVSIAAGAAPVRVGSKKFTESYVLGEIATRTLAQRGIPAEHRSGMGGTLILWEALRAGAIDAYPEYTGTIAEEIVRDPGRSTVAALRPGLSAIGIGITDPLGFNNTYALVMRSDRARTLGIAKISDLARHPELAAGLTHEFLDRRDGWGPLAARYGLSLASVRGIDHALGYAALRSGAIDVKDAYSTDARIAEDDLAVLADDLGFFPRYEAVFFLPRRALAAPAVSARFPFRQDRRSGDDPSECGGRADQDYARAARFSSGERDRHRPLGRAQDRPVDRATRPARRDFSVSRDRRGNSARDRGERLGLALPGHPLGNRGRADRSRAGAPGAPRSGALSGYFPRDCDRRPVPLQPPADRAQHGDGPAGYSCFPARIGGGARPLPVGEVDARLSSDRLTHDPRRDQTSAVIAVGTATLAALIGAGGLGEPIVSGLNLNDHATILQGAVPAALLALLVQGAFGLADRVFIPRGLRLPRE
jgi:osmoprotectant transport system permease protein